MFGKIQKAKLILFEVEGTLVKPFTLDLLPGVASWFRYHDLLPCKVGIATNQGGVAMRYYYLHTNQKKAAEYPTVEQVESRVYRLARSLDIPIPNVYMSFAYRFADGRWVETPIAAVDDIRWAHGWRKPQPGMLQQALQDNGLLPDEALVVGVSESDQKAAIAAGIPFVPAEEFFSVYEMV